MKKILIVDDKPEVRKLVSITLDGEDIEILEASNGNQALQVAGKECPNLMILDVMMPGGLDGYQVCKKIKADPKTRNIIVMLLTARGQEADKKAGTDSGADDYFVKPFSPRELLDKVYSVLKL